LLTSVINGASHSLSLSIQIGILMNVRTKIHLSISKRLNIHFAKCHEF